MITKVDIPKTWLFCSRFFTCMNISAIIQIKLKNYGYTGLMYVKKRDTHNQYGCFSLLWFRTIQIN